MRIPFKENNSDFILCYVNKSINQILFLGRKYDNFHFNASNNENLSVLYFLSKNCFIL